VIRTAFALLLAPALLAGIAGAQDAAPAPRADGPPAAPPAQAPPVTAAPPVTPEIRAEGAASTSGTERARSAPPPGFQLLDGIAATVDDRAVTFATVDEALLSGLDRIDRSDQSALQRASFQILQDFLRRRVQAQAGAELGLAPEDVRRVVRDYLAEQRSEYSPLEYGQRIRDRGSDPLREEREATLEMYESIYSGTITGRQGPGGRRKRIDRYLRPSQIRAAYLQSSDTLGTPPEVKFQVLDILGAAAGGLDEALVEARRLRDEALAGADFDAIVRANGYTARENAGRVAPVAADQIYDPVLKRFAVSARIGELSEPRPLPGDRGNLIGYRVVKLLGRSGGAPPPPLTDRETQRGLRDALLGRSDRLAVDEAGRQRLADSHVWLHPVWGVPGPTARRP